MKGVIILRRITILFVCCFLILLSFVKFTHEQPSENSDSNTTIEITGENEQVAIAKNDEPEAESAQEEPLTQIDTFQESIDEYINAPAPEEIKADTSKIYYLALGDSLTQGVGDEERKNGYTKRLVEKLEQWKEISQVVLDNRGKRGRRSDQLLKLLEKGHYDYELKNSELITITIGGNDIMKVVKKDIFELKREDFDKELTNFQERYEQILKEIREINPDVPIMVIGLYNPFSVITDEITEFESIITDWNDSIEAISTQYENACFVDIQDLFDENANLVYHTDFFHPNGYGYTIMTERIISMMKSCQIEDTSNGLILTN
ncbi:MAG TPA: GDSL-type esterase/lipase family protein [Ureibacillus sp.]|nr:GDSL-type esterase/lipase family protein [Ureibacillus sp.]